MVMGERWDCGLVPRCRQSVAFRSDQRDDDKVCESPEGLFAEAAFGLVQ